MKTRVGIYLILALFLLSFSLPFSHVNTDTTNTETTPPSSHSPAAFAFQSYEKVMNATTFVSPDGSKDALWHFLNIAEESIYVEIFGINNPYILELIHDLHDTKPSLDMKFLLGWNSIGYYSENDYVANNLTELGYEVKWTSDTEFTYAHQKFVIIDNETTIIHSGNWAKTSFPEDGNKANREWSIAINDTDVCSYYRSVFDYDWDNGIDYDAATHGTGSPLTYTGTSSTYTNPFAEAGNFYEMMNVTPVFSPDTSLDAILYCINSARYTLDIQIPYFTSIGDAGEVDEVVDAILAAKARGVTVRIISEEEKDWQEVAQTFHDNEIPIVWHDTRWFTAEHNKGIIVDGHTVLLSSINFSDGSISENREAGIIIENYNVTQWYLEIFDYDWQIADGDEHMDEVNLYWEPNIPDSTDTVNVSVFAHRHYSDVTEVNLSVQIDSDPAVNYTITSNVYDSFEEDPENYFYEISPQADGTNITVRAFVEAAGTWHNGTPMVIHVLDAVTDDIVIDRIAYDSEYELGATGLGISWSVTASQKDKYIIFRNGTEVGSGTLTDDPVNHTYSIPSVGLYNFTLFVNTTDGKNSTDTIWVNAFPAESPTIDNPADVVYELGTTSNNITWKPSDKTPDRYRVLQNNTQVANETWDGDDIVFDIDGLDIGVYNFTIIVRDGLDQTTTDTVWVTVEDTTNPTISSPADVSYEAGSTGNQISWTADDLAKDTFAIYQNGTQVASSSWMTTSLDIGIDGLSIGVYNYTIIVKDTSQNQAMDTVLVTVVDTTDPSITALDDMTYVEGSTGNTLTWTVSDLYPGTYEITRDGVVVDSGTWTGDTISVSIDGLTPGEYVYVLTVYDTSGNSASDSVIVTVEVDVFDWIQENILLVAGLGIAGVIALIVILMMKKR